jgi:hypothetical protein
VAAIVVAVAMLRPQLRRSPRVQVATADA